jgi:hypothetical protein
MIELTKKEKDIVSGMFAFTCVCYSRLEGGGPSTYAEHSNQQGLSHEQQKKICSGICCDNRNDNGYFLNDHFLFCNGRAGVEPTFEGIATFWRDTAPSHV